MSTSPTCPSCGAPVAADAPHGLCPACLLRAGMPSGTQPPPRRERWAPPTPAELAPAFPQLEIVELIGQGGMGAVYRARQLNLDRLVALKILPPDTNRDPGFAERFTREARALAKLSHPNIVAVHDFGQSGGYPYLVMEHVDGATLRHLLQSGRIAAREALAIVPAICDALQYAHDRGIVHRDIKPENILLDRRGAVKIADFGLAKLVGADAAELGLTGERDVMGTPHYMAPEQVERPLEVDHRADIYSLGVVFYQMLTGELPLGRFEAPSRRVQVDVRLDEVVLRALEKEPSRRYPQASQLKTEVETIATTSAAPVKARTVPWRVLGIALTDPWRVLGITLVVITMFVISGWVLTAVLRLKDRAAEAAQQAQEMARNGPGSGVVSSLVPERRQWREGETPRFVFEAHNTAGAPIPVFLPHHSRLIVDNQTLRYRDPPDSARLPLPDDPAKSFTLVVDLDEWTDSAGKPVTLAPGHHRFVYVARLELPGNQPGFSVLPQAEIDVIPDAAPREPEPIVTLIPDHLIWRTDETPSLRAVAQSRLAPQIDELAMDDRVFHLRQDNHTTGIPRFFAPEKSEIVIRLDRDWVDSAGLTPTLAAGRHQVTFRARFGEKTVASAGVTIEIVATPLAGDPDFDALDANPAVLEVQLRQAKRAREEAAARHAAGLITTLEFLSIETRIALLEAKVANDRGRFAEVKVKSAERALTEVRRRHATGVATTADLRAAEDTLAVEKLRLEAAQKRAGP